MRNKTSRIPGKMYNGDITYENPQDIVDAFGELFSNIVTLELVCRISRSRPRDFRLYCLLQICRMSHLGEAKHSLDSVLICRMSKQKSIQYRYPFLRTSLLFCFSALGLGLGKKSYSTSHAEQ
ncbi:hypothetical protein Zmor_023038 [Zophobas morio]|uniref:Uncharacterized protein n=1 Tax=Zophobas morio TaxID=2755281 RepID=A0AA38HZX1_9CUCU|nr:hypothetical protein Zmor_023038 [Zophobas morio]